MGRIWAASDGYRFPTSSIVGERLKAREPKLIVFSGSASVREEWRKLARQYRAAFITIECICSEETLHRRRVEARTEDIPGWPDPDWDHVEEMRSRYDSWSDERLVVDSVNPYASNLRAVEEYIGQVG